MPVPHAVPARLRPVPDRGPAALEVAAGHQAACWLAEAGPRDLPILDAVPHDPTVTPLAEAADADAPEAEAAPAG